MRQFYSIFYSGKEYIIPGDLTADEFVLMLQNKGELKRGGIFRVYGYERRELMNDDQIACYRDLSIQPVLRADGTQMTKGDVG